MGATPDSHKSPVAALAGRSSSCRRTQLCVDGRLRYYSSSQSVPSLRRRLELVLAAALLVWCQASLRVATAQQPPSRVRVGVILDLTSLIGQRRKVGIEMAVEDYYAARPGSRTRVALSFRDSAGDVVGAASAAVDLIKSEQVQAIIGPPTSAEAEFVAYLGNRTHVPVLSSSATSPGLSPSQTPFFVRTGANDSFQAAPVAAVLAAFGWHAAAVVYEDSPYGSGILPALAGELQGVGARITDRAAVPSDDRIDAMLYGFKAMATRVFVVHMNPFLAVRFFRRAREAGMMTEDYAWVATDGVGSVVDALSSDDVSAMEGVVSLRPFVQVTDPVKLLRTIDLDRLGVSATGATLLKAVRETTFRGLAGNFALVDGQRQPPEYEFVSIVGKSSRAVGFWTPEAGITQTLGADGAKGLKKILWPGDSISSPRGWVVSPNGRQLRVAVPVKHGFKEFVGVQRDSTNRTANITGYCIEVFDAVIGKYMPYPVSYQYVPYDYSSESYDNLVSLVPEQRADIVVGDVTITASRMGKVDFSMPFTDSGWSMVVAVRTETSTSMWIFLQPLTTSLWLASLAFF
ncbi:unnamed protein product [Miscanthus lutarioriparius]|uniref:Glutamate receptor n=1 Tax=Miscanthus lutarioriparius TaxID=422564 RepID=A0A811PZZ0_9POAL|nr:unnamed protein product [Miscanthus lutarioriparius]